jgi:hypothetical protein
MNLAEIQKRNQVLRDYFAGRDWDLNHEHQLKRQLILNSATLLSSYPYLCDDEWEVEPSRAEQGRGDLIFTDGWGRYAVVEVKWLDPGQLNSGRTGATRRTSNRQKRRSVESQASQYAIVLSKLLSWYEEIIGYSYTNEQSMPQLQARLLGAWPKSG